MFVFILSSSSYSSLFVKRDRQIERKTALSILLLYQCQRHPISSWRLYYLITTRNTNRQSRRSSGQVLRVAKGEKRPVFHSLLTQARGVIGPVLGLEGCLQILRDWYIAARYALTRFFVVVFYFLLTYVVGKKMLRLTSAENCSCWDPSCYVCEF